MADDGWASMAGRPPAGTDLDDRLRPLDRYCWELTDGLREAGRAVDQNPDAITDHLGLPVIDFETQCTLPPQYRTPNGHPAGILAAGASQLGRVITGERFGYGDPGVLLAAPGPTLSGLAVQALADAEQRRRYYERIAAGPTWTFFGLTEPRKGSAAIELETALTPDADGGFVLTGEKRYVGTAARAQIGVVFCRRAPGPWGIEAVLLDTSSPGFEAELLPMVGLRGARISRIRLAGVPVEPAQILGRQRPPSRRGLYGALHVLHRGRLGLAAMAMGIAQAAADYVRQNRPNLPGQARWRLDEVDERIAVLRRLVHRAAADVDRAVVNVHRIGAVKLRAAELGEEATMLAADLLGPASLVEHPWLEKVYRDARAFEFMEGTGGIHRLSVFQGLIKGDFLAPLSPAAATENAGA
ncbi:acyl-CoA dehydrogenase [Catenulispora sp. NF23]|uniref:Acyl-CoA dehydrogenase n=1 Tax=Catenulispora pinistramenti TaxID=2705254 RepID=A0ABS5KP95_9ACTN|nr:acyl-CoA dehydrogenase [Catenulispora pinistramenti]MBS2532719.1 acyl-CoA dehydrogenase [Catenulispora pinistramenti]MBS2547864.1 acyl-CoA dehydrogenase [Catenulispora pinistramenti]